MKQTISLVQMHIQPGQPTKNFAHAADLAQQAALQGSQILLLPELWSTGYDLPHARTLAMENLNLLPRLARLSRDLQIAVGGSLLLEKGGNHYNTFVFQTPHREQPDFYQKIHLFRLMEEDRWLTPGDHLQQTDAAWGRAGLAICYDLRFPELFRRYALEGVSLLLISAEWPLQRIAHWQTLLAARAIENQVFVAATNCVGETGGEIFGGCSAILSPWGETLVEGSTDEESLLTATIDLDQVSEIRERIPIFKDRRPELY